MKYSDIKQVKAFCETLFSTPDWHEVARKIADGENDFEVGNVRFIDAGDIDKIQTDKMEDDKYCLGCFYAWAIAEATGWPVALIRAAQHGEAYEEIGEAMNREQIEALQQIYSSADGYGPYFNGYDFGQEEIRVNGRLFYVFDQHKGCKTC